MVDSTARTAPPAVDVLAVARERSAARVELLQDRLHHADDEGQGDEEEREVDRRPGVRHVDAERSRDDLVERVRRDVAPASVRFGRCQLAYLYGLGFSTLLERLCCHSSDAWQR